VLEGQEEEEVCVQVLEGQEEEEVCVQVLEGQEEEEVCVQSLEGQEEEEVCLQSCEQGTSGRSASGLEACVGEAVGGEGWQDTGSEGEEGVEDDEMLCGGEEGGGDTFWALSPSVRLPIAFSSRGGGGGLKRRMPVTVFSSRGGLAVPEAQEMHKVQEAPETHRCAGVLLEVDALDDDDDDDDDDDVIIDHPAGEGEMPKRAGARDDGECIVVTLGTPTVKLAVGERAGCRGSGVRGARGDVRDDVDGESGAGTRERKAEFRSIECSPGMPLRSLSRARARALSLALPLCVCV